MAAVAIVVGAAADTVAEAAVGIATRAWSAASQTIPSGVGTRLELTPTFNPTIDGVKLRMYTGNTGVRP